MGRFWCAEYWVLDPLLHRRECRVHCSILIMARVAIAHTPTVDHACATPAMPPCQTLVPVPVKDKASFARVVNDGSEGALGILKSLGVEYIPLMVIYNAQTGEEIARHVTSSRGDLIGLFLTALERREAEVKADLTA